MKRFVIACFFGMALEGCATIESGRPIDQAVAEQFQNGIATRAQVEAAFGPPQSITRGSNGITIIAYAHIVSRATMAGSGHAVNRSVAFVFDAKGILVSASFNQSEATLR